MANPLAYHIDKTPHAVKINEKKNQTDGQVVSVLKEDLKVI